MPEATRATGDNQQREDNRSFFEKYGGTIFQMVAMWMISRYLFGSGGKYTKRIGFERGIMTTFKMLIHPYFSSTTSYQGCSA
jgi:hypothetical protein